MKKAILFDLDGTLLPMDQDIFVKTYFGLMAKRMAQFGYKPEELIHTIWTGITAVIKNDGTLTNEDVFWKCFSEVYGEERTKNDRVKFDDFYREDFPQVQSACGFQPLAKEMIQFAKQQGYRVVLATNPLFPRIATEERIRWAGLEPSDFELVTTYENSHACKPSLLYYQEILDALGLEGSECLMVGNDIGEDGVVKQLGMDIFYITDCLINPDGIDMEHELHGSFEDLKEYIRRT